MTARCPSTVERIAVHEASHAVCAAFHGMRTKRIAIEPAGAFEYLAHPRLHRLARRSEEIVLAGAFGRRACLAELEVSLAGTLGELELLRRFRYRGRSSGGKTDREDARKFANLLTETPREACALLRASEVRVARLVRRHWSSVAEIAALLVEADVLDGRELATVMRRVRKAVRS